MDTAILARVEDFCIREGLLQPGTPLQLAAAVSGGADSMALLPVSYTHLTLPTIWHV